MNSLHKDSKFYSNNRFSIVNHLKKIMNLNETQIITSHSVYRALKKNKLLHNVPEVIIHLLCQYSSFKCYFCPKRLYQTSTEIKQKSDWNQFGEDMVCDQCCVLRCICKECFKISKTALGLSYYCDDCAEPICKKCALWTFGQEILCPDCLY